MIGITSAKAESEISGSIDPFFDNWGRLMDKAGGPPPIRVTLRTSAVGFNRVVYENLNAHDRLGSEEHRSKLSEAWLLDM
ncbi:hypothetical protein BG005_008456 [Podila minutissima]|nr:hypothetical protein BG005_008456 [Podila minutissima]